MSWDSSTTDDGTSERENDFLLVFKIVQLQGQLIFGEYHTFEHNLELGHCRESVGSFDPIWTLITTLCPNLGTENI